MASTPTLIERTPAQGSSFSRGHYLTDGRRLFRVVSGFDPHAAERFATLEDCVSLALERYAPEQLAAMDLRIVTPAHDD